MTHLRPRSTKEASFTLVRNAQSPEFTIDVRFYVLLLFLLWSSKLTAAQIRDLRKIDSRIPNLVPTILVRKESILVNILHLRALIKADAVVLFDTYGSVDSRLHSTFLYHLQVCSVPAIFISIFPLVTLRH